MAEKGLNCGINKTVIMATKITVPDIGDFENVEIIEILAKPGSVIKKNDPVVTLESDKSSVEVPSPFSAMQIFTLTAMTLILENLGKLFQPKYKNLDGNFWIQRVILKIYLKNN